MFRDFGISSIESVKFKIDFRLTDRSLSQLNLFYQNRMKPILILASLFFMLNVARGQSADSLSIALDLIDLSFKNENLDSMASTVRETTESFREIRKMSIPN